MYVLSILVIIFSLALLIISVYCAFTDRNIWVTISTFLGDIVILIAATQWGLFRERGMLWWIGLIAGMILLTAGVILFFVNRQKQKPVVFALFGLLVLCFAFFARSTIPHSNILHTSSFTPNEVVMEYYTHLAAGDTRTAMTFLSNQQQSFQQNATDSDFKNIFRLSDIKVDGPYAYRADNQYKLEVQVVAHYKTIYFKETSSRNGPQMRFIYLGRNSNQEPWMIIGIGTGP